MDDSLHNKDLLIRYLDGEMANDERLALEERLQSEENLLLELNNLQIAIQAIRQYGTIEQVGAIHQQMMQEIKGQKQAKVVSFRKTIRYTMAVAASALVLFVGIRLYMNAQVSPEKLYNEAFVDFNLSAARGSKVGGSDIEKLYEQKNYSAVTTASRSRLLSAKDSLLIGLSYLHIDKTNQAIHFFEQLSASGNDFQQDAQFYLSLSYLKEKNYQKAAALMKVIEGNPAHLYHEQISTELVEDVEALQNK